MKKPLDKVTDAYLNEMGDTFGEKIRKRIHWICEHAKGEHVLDIGCSQGITSLILGREGKHVLGMDLLQESIDYANEMLAKEEEITKKYVQFVSANFMNYDFNDSKFDCIIMGEVLEHITDPERFVRKAERLLNENGKIIITVPFGINDYFDHKKTYYLLDLLKLKPDNMGIEKIKFLGKWVGLILTNTTDKGLEIEESLLQNLEAAFYTIERQYVTDMQTRGNTIKRLNNNLKEKESASKVTAEMEKKLADKDSQIESLKNEINALNKMLNEKPATEQPKNEKLETELNILKDAFGDSKKDVIKVRKEKITLQEKLLESYKKEQTLLNTQKKLLKSNTQLERKYNALSSSKLGKVTLSYWTWRKQKSGGK
jgi:2-polyprenyl-3-methyl-5-hydroxy-6-metoxy-1,4-benzoquinol methylase